MGGSRENYAVSRGACRLRPRVRGGQANRLAFAACSRSILISHIFSTAFTRLEIVRAGQAFQCARTDACSIAKVARPLFCSWPLADCAGFGWRPGVERPRP